MRWFFILSIWLQAPFAQAQLSDNCESARELICSSKPVSEDSPRINSAIINSEINIGPLSGEPKLDPDKRKIAIARKHLEEHMAKIGLTQKNVLDKLSDVKRVTSENYSSGRMGPTAYDQGPFSNSELGKRVSGITIITPFSDSKFLDNPEVKKSYLSICGDNGLRENATYVEAINSVIICPGQFINTLNTGNLDSLNFLVAHELTHSLGPMKFEKQHPLKYPHFERFANFTACLQTHYGDELEDYRKIQASIQAEKTKITTFVNGSPANMKAYNQADANVKLKKLDESLVYINYYQKLIADITKRSATPAEMHGEETVADLGAHLALTEILKSTPVERRMNVVAANLRRFCGTKTLEGSFKGYRDDGTHASESFRFQTFFNNPEARQLLGCKAPQGQKPWCTPRSKPGSDKSGSSVQTPKGAQ